MKQIFLAITVIFFISCTILKADTVLNETQLLKDSKEIYSLMGNLNRAVADKNSKRIRDIADLDSKEANVKETADFALKILAKTIILQAQKHGFKYCRWGGEEFVLLCRDTKIEQASLIAEKIRELIASFAFKVNVQVTASFGVATLNANETLEQLFNHADKALYDAKHQGRNRVVAAEYL